MAELVCCDCGLRSKAVSGGHSPVEAQKKTEHSSSNGSVLANAGNAISTEEIYKAAGMLARQSTVAPEPPVGEYTDTDDLSSVISRAENSSDPKDKEIAQDKLSEWAKELGYTQDDLDE